MKTLLAYISYQILSLPKVRATAAWDPAYLGSSMVKNQQPPSSGSGCQAFVRHGAERLRVIIPSQGEELGDSELQSPCWPFGHQMEHLHCCEVGLRSQPRKRAKGATAVSEKVLSPHPRSLWPEPADRQLGVSNLIPPLWHLDQKNLRVERGWPGFCSKGTWCFQFKENNL